MVVAIAGDRKAFDQFHDKEWSAGLSYPAVEHLGDVGVVHHRQGLALGFKARDDLPGIHARLDDLEGDAPTHRLALLGQIDHSTATLPNLLQQLVAADPVTGLFGNWQGSEGD